ncbi:hypothetical protein SAMN04488502_10119 [Dendrosporobacter quercicolus]|uniref:Uncharacterized protein n=1 Tax=Dendrosporobacter quercicolus TaxID=146817 RepID=A0A1G9KFN5_9FIRM|nr:hypothetical protein SAMN04488502_10119 [Dendrosporobacter quercicolus]
MSVKMTDMVFWIFILLYLLMYFYELSILSEYKELFHLPLS